MDITTWLKTFGQEFARLTDQLAAYLPRLLMAAALVVGGWLAAKLLRALSVRLLTGLDRLWHRFIAHRGLEQLQTPYPPARLAGEIVFWLVILFVVAGAAALLGLGTFVAWLSQVAAYLPILLTGLLIILAGIVISALTRDLVTSTAHRAGLAQSGLLGRLTQAAILLTAVTVGIDQIGIDITFIAITVGIALAAALGAAALAFGLGARDYVSNVIAGHQLRDHYRTGDTVRIRDIEGTVVEITATRLVLSTERGRVTVPARLFEQEIAALVDTPGRDSD